VLALLQGMVKGLEQLLASVDPSVLHARDAVKLLEAASAVEQRAAALKTLVAERAAEAGAWSREGYRSPEAWLSQKTGVGYGEAAATLAASEKLPDLPAVDEALRRGELSGPQVQQVVPAATAENEQCLLEAAGRENLNQLRKTCDKEKARRRTAEQERARQERIRKERFFKSWTDGDGAYRFEGKATAAVGARIEAAISAEADNQFKTASADGRRDSAGAYRMDALEHLITEGGANVDTTVVIRADASALAGGEGVCETSTGPVPVEEAIGAILAGAFVKLLLRDGVDITGVSHQGRHIPVELRSAVVERDGYACVRPGCGATQHLQVHHWVIDYAKPGGATAYWNLATVCRHDHQLVTHGGHKLEGGPGKWNWIPPP
jgi:hypothetical protein